MMSLCFTFPVVKLEVLFCSKPTSSFFVYPSNALANATPFVPVSRVISSTSVSCNRICINISPIQKDDAQKSSPESRKTATRVSFHSPVHENDESNDICRKVFPPNFTFGVCTSAFQVEGAVRTGGRGESIWDTFTSIPGKIRDGSNAIVACNHYNLVSEDIKQIKSLGVDAYRFSLSWSRLFPDGIHINPEAVDFYNAMIDKIVAAGITPYVTIYHWDLPQTLNNDPNVLGWRTKHVVQYYTRLAEACFQKFGDRVKHWITFNELQITSIQGYGIGNFAPGRCSDISGESCRVGDSATEPYLVMHHQLLSHAAAVKIYRTKYQKKQGGKIGVTVNSQWYEPFSLKEEDIDAAQRYQEFELGWQLDPVVRGQYPRSMIERVSSRLPLFTSLESKDLKGSFDFIGVNYYTSNFAKDGPEEQDLVKRWWGNDMGAIATSDGPDGEPIGELMGTTDNPWLYNYPWGLFKLLEWIDKRYGKFPIYITENGTMDRSANTHLPDVLQDYARVRYLKGHLQQLSKVMREKTVDVRGYFVWGYMDDFEWSSGYRSGFGLVHVDFGSEFLARTPKASAHWYTNFLKGSNNLQERETKGQGADEAAPQADAT